MTSLFMIASSALEVGLVVVAAVIFVALVVAALAVFIWSLAGVVSATHDSSATHH